MSDKNEGDYDWTEVLAAYEAYYRSLSASDAVYTSAKLVGFNEFLDCEYEGYVAGARFESFWPDDLGLMWRDRASWAVSLMAELHAANLPSMDRAAAEDLANAYASYVAQAFDAGVPTHGWTAPAIDEFYRGDYALWVMTRDLEGPNPYAELFGAMTKAAKAVEMDIAAATAPAMDERDMEPTEPDRNDEPGR